MSWLKRTFGTTIGKKVLVGITGLGLVIFLIGHLGGNLNLYAGPESFNAYAEKLHHGWFLGPWAVVLAEIGLALLFVVHVGLTVSLVIDNRRARGTAYAKLRSKRGRPMEALASKAMAVSGVVVLVFLVVHLIDFRLQRGSIEASDRSLYEVVVNTLQGPAHAALYAIATLLVGLHVFHGFQSAFRSLGVNRPRLTPALMRIGMALGVLLGLGFASLPIWIFFFHG